ncbi:hypothetical protein [Piscinibacter sakaiensis]|uniref:hypothetical protein n=1 Tax=Piscinibacter sakaiensis TaxID=1547922 RepID=UPI003AAF3963
MEPLIWQVVYDLDGGLLDTGPGPSNDRFGEVGAGRSGTPLGNHYVRRAIAGHSANTSRGQSATGVGADLFYTAMHNMNIVAADQAEQQALEELSPQIYHQMPAGSGGVLVASIYRFQGASRGFTFAYVVGAAPVSSWAINDYLARGSIRDRDSRQKLWWVTIKRQMKPDSATPGISSWP